MEYDIIDARKVMTIEQAVVERLRALPPYRQQEVLDFVESLERGTMMRPRQSVEGLWSDLAMDVTDEEIAEARREMWAN